MEKRLDNMSIRFDYDDQYYDIIGKVNDALSQYGIQFEDDEKEHDGFCVCNLEVEPWVIKHDAMPKN